MNKPNKHNNVIGISSLQNWLYNLFNSTGFHFKSKVIEGSYKGKNMIFFNIWAILPKMYYFCVCDIFFLHSGYPINSYLINWLSNQQYVFERCFWWSIFRLNYQKVYGHQTFRVRHAVRSSHPEMHMKSQRSGLVRSHDK